MNDVALYKVKALIDVANKIMDAYIALSEQSVDGVTNGLKAAFDIVMDEARATMALITTARDSE